MRRFRFAGPVVVAVVLLTIATAPFNAQQLQYPKPRKADKTDTYFGVSVPDPYRWLEDDHSAETAEWVAQENKLTFSYLAKIPYREQVKQRLEKLLNYSRYSAPFRRGEYFFFFKNDGLQNQAVLYVQKGLDGAPEVLLDPNKFSEDGTAQLSAFSLSRDGKYAAYAISSGGSDWQEFYVLEVATRKTLSDRLKWAKFSGAAWQGYGFYYNRFPAPKEGSELSSKNTNESVYFHKVGAAQSEDELVFEDKENPLRLSNVDTTEDERFAILTVSDPEKGKKGNALYARDSTDSGKAFTPIVGEISDDTFGVITNLGDKLLVQTNRNAPNSKIVLCNTKSPAETDWKLILPEKAEPLDSATAAGGKLFVSYTKDVTTRAYVHSLEGKLENEVKLPGLGTASGFGGQMDDKFVFYVFTSFTVPPTIYRYDIGTQKTSTFRAPEIKEFRSGDYETEQVFYHSKDGTRVPMFIVHKKGLKLDGNNPTILYGYGGFNVNIAPSFSTFRLAELEQGVVYASANIRGGGEYGEKWHTAGTKLQKQNVFDDFIAAAEYLIKNRYTSPQKLAVEGGSNGGLLVGAVIDQRPELFRAAVAQAGVLDMLRFHKFTIGSAWISDYGSSDNQEEFKALYRYSPVHNVRPGVKYPATLITTADHDDRVVPAHSFKFAATLQEKAGTENPILIRIETKSGHGPSSTTKALEITADVYAFVFHNLGVDPRY